jgi:agmatine deiminase
MREIQSREQVRINVPNDNWDTIVGEQLKEHGCPTDNIFFHPIKTNESWCRDHGPAFVLNGKKVAIVDWGFNAWGGKYPPYDDDDAVPTRIAEAFKLPVFYPNIVMEGGSVEFNGAGTVLTTEECLLDPVVQVRNPGLTKGELETVLRDYLGARAVLWLGRGIAGDDTHGHVDDLCRFVRPDTVVLCRERDSRDSNYAALEENRERLQGMRTADGRAVAVVDLPMPAPRRFAGQRLPASYANFYVANAAVLVPTFNDPADRIALGILADLFDRPVVGIHAVDLVLGLGTLHCLTQQEPRAGPGA